MKRRTLDQLLAIVDYIGEDNPSAAVELARQICTRCDALAKYPWRCKEGRGLARAR